METPPVLADDGIDDWGNLLDDFSIADDGSLILPWGTFDEVGTSPLELPPLPVASSPSVVPSPAEDSVGRVRKRDPRLICPNYLAGRVPCSCPELDKKAEEVVAGARKRARSGTASAGVVRCQVPGCEADISELKGYHKRHRVCLRCANSSSVVLNGEQKRYCQQCGKNVLEPSCIHIVFRKDLYKTLKLRFHVLNNFDEGKRSCRRKLEWHNKRRRRKNNDPNNTVEEEAEAQGAPLLDVTCDGELLRERSSALGCDTAETALSNKTQDRDAVDSADGQGSPIGSLPSLKNNELASSVDAQKDEKTALSKSSPSSTLADEKNTYSSVCPTGRISFKLYDWNPAEFPRRLRHQIFQWLASMPVELEGYIRPGCTILTLFIAMPKSMWEKITQEADHCVRDLINQPGSLLLGRGNFLIYLSNTIIHVLQDGTTLTNIKMEVQAPRLHYVYPAYLEAGKPLEFVACGSNLWQPKFRFLFSFCGKYLKHEVQRITCSEHEMFRIKVTHTDLEVFGPAFVEVENVSGLSNFIPVLVGSKDICSELKRIEEGFTGSCYDGNFEFHADSSVSCKFLMSRQYCMSTLLLDIAWVLKTPHPEDNEHFWSLINVERITTLLKFLLPNKYLSIIRVIVHHLDDIILIKGFDKAESWTCSADLKRFHECLNRAKEIISQEKLYDFRSAIESRNSISGSLMLQSKISNMGDTYCANQDAETISESSSSDSLQPNVENDANVPLVTEDIIDRQRCYQNSFVDIFSNKTTRSQFPLFIAASVILCLIVCTIVLHPREARELAVSIRRCKLGNTA